MRILITNNTLAARAGTELYVRDLATALLERGHQPVAFSTRLGPVADELRRATIPVVSDLSKLGDPPDLIHGQHHLETMTALLWFPGVPAVSFCHGWLPWEEAPPRSSRILRYVAVDDTCRDRLVCEWGIAAGRVEVILNFVDLSRFTCREPLPPRPRRALLFANTASEATHLPPVRQACERLGIVLEVAGQASGRVLERPEEVLPGYDLVFAKARAALEAMAVGAAVVACDAHGLAGLVTSERFERLRRLNFGVRSLSRPVDAQALLEEIGLYDPVDAARVSARVRREASREQAVDRIVDVYHEVLAAWRAGPGPDATAELREAGGYLRWLGPELKSRHELDSRLLASTRQGQSRVTAELHQARAELQAREAELARIRRTLTWRLRGRILRWQPLLRLYRALRRLPAAAPAGLVPPLAGRPDAATLQARFEARAGGRFMGVPVEGFAESGRMQLLALLQQGLEPGSRVLDVGCGCLRGGYWLLHYLEPGRYFGIEPHAGRVAFGREQLLEPGLERAKRPRFSHNADFDLSVFGQAFDFVLADSIWTHAAKAQIRRMLDSLLTASHAGTVLLASYLPAGPGLGPDYDGTEWVGTSDRSEVPGVVRHDLGWILGECRSRGLQVVELPNPAPDAQRWLRIVRA